MEHRMILATADLSVIHKAVIARRREDAGVAQEEEHPHRKRERGASSASPGPNSEPQVQDSAS